MIRKVVGERRRVGRMMVGVLGMHLMREEMVIKAGAGASRQARTGAIHLEEEEVEAAGIDGVLGRSSMYLLSFSLKWW